MPTVTLPVGTSLLRLVLAIKFAILKNVQNMHTLEVLNYLKSVWLSRPMVLSPKSHVSLKVLFSLIFFIGLDSFALPLYKILNKLSL